MSAAPDCVKRVCRYGPERGRRAPTTLGTLIWEQVGALGAETVVQPSVAGPFPAMGSAVGSVPASFLPRGPGFLRVSGAPHRGAMGTGGKGVCHGSHPAPALSAPKGVGLARYCWGSWLWIWPVWPGTAALRCMLAGRRCGMVPGRSCCLLVGHVSGSFAGVLGNHVRLGLVRKCYA